MTHYNTPALTSSYHQKHPFYQGYKGCEIIFVNIAVRSILKLMNQYEPSYFAFIDF